MSRTSTSLVAAIALLPACREAADSTTIEFETVQTLFDVDVDSGEVTIADGATTRLQTAASAGYTIRAAAVASEGDVRPIGGSGEISVQGSFSIDISAAVDIPVGSVDDFATSVDYEFETEIGVFDPFVLDGAVTMLLGAPVEDRFREPIVGLPGGYYVLEYATGHFTPTFEGVCLRQDGDAVQYTGAVAIDPDIRYLASIEIEVPLAGTQVLGPVGIDIDVPPLVTTPVDLGTFSLSSGAPVDGVAPCDDA